MIEPQVRKTQLMTERVSHSAGRPLDTELHRGSIAVVLENPFAGRFAEETEITAWMHALQPLANDIAQELRDSLARDGRQIETYGKGAIVGGNGELEIAAAWHVPGGAGLRHALDSPKAMVPASKKVGSVGSQVDVPLVYIHASYLRSHYDVVPVSVGDAPGPNEVVYIHVMSTGERPNARISGGFSIDEVDGADGLR
ncbi:MAG: amino acid synthesis family protein [Acidimicrobiales bacterium]